MHHSRRGFTIIELLVVITIVVILATITIFAFGSWRKRSAVTEVKFSLSQVASAMKNELNFNNAYPTSVPSTANGSGGVTVTYVSGDASTYCIEGVSKAVPTVKMFIRSDSPTPQMGTCSAGVVAVNENTGTASYTVWTDVAPWIGNICGVSYDGKLYCWGSGVGRPVIKSLGGGMSEVYPVSVSQGGTHVCMLGSDSNAYCYGANTNGQLGDGTTTDAPSTAPVAVSRSGVLAGLTVKKVSAGGSRTCVIASDNYLYCWGAKYFNIASPAQSAIPVKVDVAGKTVVDVDAGANATCAVTSDGLAYCWGFPNGVGQLGTGGQFTASGTPLPVSTTGALSGVRLTTIKFGNENWCALDDQGRAYCWGANYNGELGDGTTTNRYAPVQVAMTGALSGKTLKSISPDSTTCAIASDNKPYCWGGSAGLGNGATVSSLVPVAVDMTAMSGQTVNKIVSRGGNVCAITNLQKLYCWGIGPLGDGRIGTNANSSVPVLVLEP